MKRLAARARGEESGFTLVELMVVVAIIGLLIAIAVPTFLGARTRAQDKAAEASLRNALVAAKVAYTDQDSYVTATVTNLASIEPSLGWTTGQLTVTDGSNRISVTDTGYTANGVANAGWAAADMSASGSCFWINDITVLGSPAPGTFYEKTTATNQCSGADAESASSPTPAGAGW